MTTIDQTAAGARLDALSGERNAFIDRWIYVFTAALFVVVILTGFIPDSMDMLADVKAGHKPPLPLVLHVHAVLMGSYLLLLLVQTWLVATGKTKQHRALGLAGAALALALVVVGFILAPTMYHQLFAQVQAVPPLIKAKLLPVLGIVENIMLLQLRTGFGFAILVGLGLAARRTDPGFHKRMMILSIAAALPAGINRIPWLPNTMPVSPLSADIYALLVIAPLFLWDVFRNRGVHRAYWAALAVMGPLTIAVHALWNTPFWHATAKRLMGV